MNKRIVFSIMIVTLLFMSSLVEQVSAFTTITLNPYSFYKTDYSWTHDNQDMNVKYGVLPNGKVIYAWTHGDSTFANAYNYFVAVYNTDGSQYSFQELTYGSNKAVLDTSIYVVSDTEVYIMVQLGWYATYYYYSYGVIKYNPATSSVITIVEATGINSGSSMFSPMDNILTSGILYNSKVYWLCAMTFMLAPNQRNPYIYLMEFTPSTTLTATSIHALSGGVMPTVGYISNIYWFQSPLDSSKAYTMYSSNDHALSYYEVNLATKVETLLSAMPISTDEVLPENSGYSKFFGGGVKVNGTQLHIYFTFCNSKYTGGNNILLFIQYQGIFNNTLSSANFISHNRDAISTTLGYTSSGQSVWITGYETDYKHYTMYFPQYNVGGADTLGRLVFSISDWYGTHDISYQYIADSTDSIPLPNKFARVGFQNHNSQWGLGGYRTAFNLYIYSGLSIVGGTYTLTATYSPADTPLIQAKSYTWTVTMKLNGLVYPQGIVSIKVDGVPLSSGGTKVTDINGRVTWTFQFSSTGVHNMTYSGYSSMGAYVRDCYLDLVYTIVSPTTTPSYGQTPELMLSAVTNLMIIFLPTSMAIMIPALAGAKVAKTPGFILGSLVGVLICVQVGLLPPYSIYLIILVCAIAFIMVLKGSGGGQQ